jgi:TolB-like protein/DNA-binding winged helix-turn-helix (wHTH) protein/tetratricopeptide (TPR) repeat protein
MRNRSDPKQRVRLRFGVFELDERTGELRKAGARIRIAGQPLRLLERLLDRPGDLVTREELRQELWSEDTFVDFECNLNSAIKRLRAALGDSADTPRFIETLPRRGYRFLVPVERTPIPPAPDDRAHPADVALPPESADPPTQDATPEVVNADQNRRLRWLVSAAVLVIMAAGALGYMGWRDRPPRFQAIAVLPFVLANPVSAEDEYIGFGMSEALITELSKMTGLRVISQTSSMQYKNAGKALPAIAEELGVDVVVEGSVQREGDRVRITVQLIEAATDAHLWAENYERDLGGVLALVDDVARSVAEQIHVHVAPSDALRSRASKSVDPRVAEAYLKGRYHLGRGNETDFVRAVSYFEAALVLDPTHAPSHAGLADYYIVTDALLPEVATGKARLHAAKALALDETLPDAHASLAFLHFYYDWNWTDAEREFRRALELDPGHRNAHRWYGLFLSAMGRHAEALAQIQTALEIDPISISNHDAAGTVRFNARQYAETTATGRDIHALNAFDTRGHEHMAMGLMQQRRLLEALHRVEEGLEAQSNIALDLIRLVCLGRLGRTVEADRALAAFTPSATRRYVPDVVTAVAYAELGRRSQALDRLEQAYEQHDPYLVLINVSPWFDSLRDDLRFQRLRDRLNFPS